MSTSTAEKYMITARQYTRQMQGDRDEDSAAPCDDDYIADADSVEEARRIIANLGDDYHDVEVRRTRYGIGSVTRWVFEVARLVPDDDGDGWEDAAPVEVVDVLDERPDIRRAWESCKHDFYAFLDYKAEGYDQVADALADED